MKKIKEYTLYVLEILYGRFFFFIFSILPLKNKVVFSSFSGVTFNDNPKYISLKLKENYPKIKQVWIKRRKKDIKDFPKDVKVVNWGSLKMIYELATAKIWVDNFTKPYWIRKRKKQFYIETWHGGLGFKKLDSDIQNFNFKSKTNTKYNSKIVDLFVSNSDWTTNIYRHAFWYNGEFIQSGNPRSDIFFETEKFNNIKQKVFNHFNIDKNKKIVLYAPTFREYDYTSLKQYNIDYTKIKKKFEEKFNCEVVILLRLHSRIMNGYDKTKLDKTIINATHYDDMQELIIASDFFISDYSSGIFDFALLKRPAFIYANDIDEYNEKRGLYFNFRNNEIPFSVAENQEELEKNILNYNQKDYEKNINMFFKDVKLCENGTASQKIVEIIIEKIGDYNNAIF